MDQKAKMNLSHQITKTEIIQFGQSMYLGSVTSFAIITIKWDRSLKN